MNNEPLISTISVQDLKRLLDENAHLYLIDVRELNEWEEVHIPKAIHIPKDELPYTIGTHIADLNQPIYLHCKAGVRSLDAAQKLINMGYKHVYSVEGGILQWMEHHYPVKKKSN